MDISYVHFYSVLSIVVVFICIVVKFLVKTAITKYAETKGVNQATKEDIGGITKIVEDIKADLSRQNELIKAQLILQNQHVLNIKSAEREAIFSYNKSISSWIYLLVRIPIGKYGIENYKEFRLMSETLSERHYACDLSEAHLYLFYRDADFTQLKQELTIAVINLDTYVKKVIQRVYFNFSKAEILLQHEESIREQNIIRSTLDKELHEVVIEYYKESTEHYNIIFKLHSNMLSLLYERCRLLETLG